MSISFTILVAAGTLAAAEPPEGMVLVPGGPFTMGFEGGSPDERPARRVEVEAFFIDRLEVTNARYSRFVEATAHAPPPDWPGGKPDPRKVDHPVVNVSWFDANDYARWAGGRLPSEEEWEKAARGGDASPLPWGETWDPARAVLDLGEGNREIRPAGSFPSGASPCGALDMAGNAWEWTADWYRPYPGNEVPSIHAGEKYRVVRGGGAIDFYPPQNARRLTVRARVQPFGRHDGLGFRLARDAAGPLRTAPDLKPPSRTEGPRIPEVESPAEVAARYSKGVDVAVWGGTEDEPEIATFGLPFPEGVLRSAGDLRAAGPVQARALARWRDGSVRWALIDAPVPAASDGPRALTVRFDGRGESPPPPHPLEVREEEGALAVDTGRAVLRVRRDRTRWLEVQAGTGRLDGPQERVTVVEDDGRTFELGMGPPASVVLEDRGPFRARIRAGGWLKDREGKDALRWRARIDARAGQASFTLLHTFTHLSPRKVLRIREYGLRFGAPGTDEPAEWGGRGTPLRGGAGARLEQLSSIACRFTAPGAPDTPGTRGEGWIAFGKDGGTLIGLRHFWEQFPTAIEREAGGVLVSLWTGPEPFEADQGLAKSHELVLSLDAVPARRRGAMARLERPAFGIAPPDWYCATRGLGDLAPHDLSRFPQYETEVEAAADLLARERPYGMRHFGDYYYGGPYKGINAYMNLEYDVPYSHLIQFARTGERKYLEEGIVQARHQGDIDLKHDGGPQWKHSPRHTTTEAELGHVFLRGLVASTWITGDPEGLENARVLGDWLVRVVANPRAQGNERQIGWALYALTGIYEATWDERYLAAMRADVDRLLAGQDALGRFSIRWDNRISFFYGITLSGFVKYHEVTGDERIAGSIGRIVARLHGFYPEYAGRTLEGLAWLYARTGDPEVRATCRRTWETTMTWRPFDIGGMTILTVRFLPMVEALGLACPSTWEIPDVGPREDGMRRHHYRAGSGTLFLDRLEGAEPLDLVLLRHVGLSAARVRATGGRGREIASLSLPPTGEPLQYQRVRLEGPGPFRVEIESSSTRAWDIITRARMRRVFHVPLWKDLEALTPRLHFRVREGAKEIRLSLEGEKEGFKGCVLQDPAGNVAGALSGFIDFGDEKRHTYELTVPVPAGGGEGKLWSLELQALTVKTAEGIVPYVSTAPEAWFDPES